MAQSGPRASREPAPEVAAAADTVAAALIADLDAGVRAAGAQLAASEVAGSEQIGAAAVALVARDLLLERFDRLGLGLMDEAVGASTKVGGTTAATFRLVARLAGRTDSGARYAFGRVRPGAKG